MLLLEVTIAQMRGQQLTYPRTSYLTAEGYGRTRERHTEAPTATRRSACRSGEFAENIRREYSPRYRM